jgi:hypothetical protein
MLSIYQYLAQRAHVVLKESKGQLERLVQKALLEQLESQEKTVLMVKTASQGKMAKTEFHIFQFMDKRLAGGFT